MTSARHRLLPIAAALLITLSAACAAPSASKQAAVPQPTNSTDAAEPSVAAATPAAARTSAPPATNTPKPEPTEAPTDTPTSEPSEPTATAQPNSEPTPAPAGIDALAAAFPGAPQAAGEAILLTGKVLDSSGAPVEGAAVEIWQTDANGIYDHPGDPDTASRDQAFQFYGTSVADATGAYLFRTIKPGQYEPRPRHIHVKVRLDGAEVLTTQFYFAEDRATLGSEGVFQQSGSLGDLLILKSAGSVEMDGLTVPVLTNDLVIGTGPGAGSLTPTPRQAEGPYYPIARVADTDNDLTVAR